MFAVFNNNWGLCSKRLWADLELSLQSLSGIMLESGVQGAVSHVRQMKHGKVAELPISDNVGPPT